jgi:hypothetical protein
VRFNPQALLVLALFAVTLLLAVNRYIGAASITALTVVDVLYAWLVLGRAGPSKPHTPSS